MIKVGSTAAATSAHPRNPARRRTSNRVSQTAVATTARTTAARDRSSGGEAPPTSIHQRRRTADQRSAAVAPIPTLPESDELLSSTGHFYHREPRLRFLAVPSHS